MATNFGTDENYARMFDFLMPRVSSWTKDLSNAFGAIQPTGLQKDLLQSLVAETMFYNSFMSNGEIIAVLAGIIRNISTGHAYGSALDWGKRSTAFQSRAADK